MKARVKATGEIVDVVMTQRVTHTGEQVYMTNDGCLIAESRLDFNIDDTPDYWTRLEHTYAGMAMQGLCANTKFMQDHEGDFQCHEEMIAEYAKDIAHTLVEKMKEERK